MSKIKIDWLTDEHDCEVCGWNTASGARVTIDGVVALEMLPVAHCTGGQHYNEMDVYEGILLHLGHKIEIGSAA